MSASTDTTTASPAYRSRLRLPANGLGDRLFSAAMCLRVPYFASVLPVVRAQITTWVTPRG